MTSETERKAFEEWLKDCAQRQYPFYEKSCAQHIETCLRQIVMAAESANRALSTPQPEAIDHTLAMEEALSALRVNHKWLLGHGYDEQAVALDSAIASLTKALGR